MKLVNQQIIKNNNLKMIYQYVHQNKGISRAQLAKLSGLSKTTVSSLIEELIERNFLEDTGILDDTSAVGRKPNALQLLHGQYYVVVISWDKRDIQAKLVDICGFIVKEVQDDFLVQDDSIEQDEYVAKSKMLFEKLLLKDFSSKQILGICIIVPGMIDSEKEEIFTTTLRFASTKEKNLIQDLRKSFSDYTLAILNDTACAAYGEKIYAPISQKDFAYINFQHGIGAALFIEDKLLGKATAFYTQFGHCCVNSEGKQCSCGNKGCLELEIGEEMLKERLLTTGCKSTLCHEDNVTYAQLHSAALYGDQAAQKVIGDISKDFTFALCNLVCIVRPKLVVIGGKGKELGELFLEETINNLQKTGFRPILDSIQIRYSNLDSTAYFIGGMKYFFDIHYDFTVETAKLFYMG